jgi:hypothetical protein
MWGVVPAPVHMKCGATRMIHACVCCVHCATLRGGPPGVLHSVIDAVESGRSSAAAEGGPEGGRRGLLLCALCRPVFEVAVGMCGACCVPLCRAVCEVAVGRVVHGMPSCDPSCDRLSGWTSLSWWSPQPGLAVFGRPGLRCGVGQLLPE